MIQQDELAERFKRARARGEQRNVAYIVAVNGTQQISESQVWAQVETQPDPAILNFDASINRALLTVGYAVYYETRDDGEKWITSLAGAENTGVVANNVLPVNFSDMQHNHTSISEGGPLGAAVVGTAQLADSAVTPAKASGLGGAELGYIVLQSGTFGTLKSNFAASAAPTTGDDSADGYAVGSLWIDTTNDNIYQCVDASVGAAVWEQLNGGGGGGYATIEDEGTPLTQRSILNFIGDTVTAADDGVDTTNVTVDAANKTLSNLSATTLINRTLSPGTSNTFDIGATSAYWRGVYQRNNYLLAQLGPGSPPTGFGILWVNSATNELWYTSPLGGGVSISEERASLTLDNLDAPTAINASLTPDSNNTRDLGTTSTRWQDAYLGTGLHLTAQSAAGAAGELVNNSTQNQLRFTSVASQNMWLSGVVYQQTTPVTVTDAAATFAGIVNTTSAKGSLTIQANAIQNATVIEVTIPFGYDFTGGATGQLQFNFLEGATLRYQTNAAISAATAGSTALTLQIIRLNATAAQIIPYYGSGPLQEATAFGANTMAFGSTNTWNFQARFTTTGLSRSVTIRGITVKIL